MKVVDKIENDQLMLELQRQQELERLKNEQKNQELVSGELDDFGNQEEMANIGKKSFEKKKDFVKKGAKVDLAKKTKKKTKTVIYIVRIVLSGGLDMIAWAALLKQHPLLAIILVISFILLFVFICLFLVFILMYLFNSFLGFLPDPEVFMGKDDAALSPQNIKYFAR